MGSIAVAGGIAIAIVLVTRGSLSQLLRLRIQSVWLALLGLTIQVVLDLVDFPDDRIDDLGFALLMASYVLLLAFCFVNIRVPAMWIVTLGIALNAAVIGLNQGMPTRDREVTTASGRSVERPIERTVKHRPESGDDLLPFLGDQIVIPEPIDEVIPVGDIVLGVGIVGVCYLGSRPRRSARSGRRPRASARGWSARRRSRSKQSVGSPTPRPSLNPLPVTTPGSTLPADVVQTVAKPKSEPAPEPAPDPELEHAPEAEPSPEPAANPTPDPEPELEHAPEAEPSPEPAADPEPAPNPEPQPASDVEPQPAPEHEAEAEPEPEPQPSPEQASEHQAEPEPQPSPEQASEHEAEPEPEPEHAQARPAGDEGGRDAKDAGDDPGDRPSEGDR